MKLVERSFTHISKWKLVPYVGLFGVSIIILSLTETKSSIFLLKTTKCLIMRSVAELSLGQWRPRPAQLFCNYMEVVELKRERGERQLTELSCHWMCAANIWRRCLSFRCLDSGSENCLNVVVFADAPVLLCTIVYVRCS